MKTFRSWNPEQTWLLPPSVDQLVPKGDLAHFVRDTVLELDLSAILESYDEERGNPPFDPRMMTALLLYAYCRGIYASRRMAQACERDTGFMAVTAMETPDFRTIAVFRKRHLEALQGLFVPKGRTGEARSRGVGWHEGEGQRLEAQGHELRPDGRP